MADAKEHLLNLVMVGNQYIDPVPPQNLPNSDMNVPAEGKRSGGSVGSGGCEIRIPVDCGARAESPSWEEEGVQRERHPG